MYVLFFGLFTGETVESPMRPVSDVPVSQGPWRHVAQGSERTLDVEKQTWDD